MKSPTTRDISATLPWRASHESLLWLVIGAAVGIAAFPLALLEVRWIVYGMVALALFLLVVLVPDRRALLLAFFVLSFQADVSLYLTHQFESSWIGTSGPPGIRLPLVTLTAAALFAYEWLTNGRLIREFDWGGRTTRWAMAFLLVSAVSLVNAKERSLGAYSLLNLFELWLVFLVTVNVIRSRRDARFVVDLLMLALALQCVLYFLQVTFGATFSLLGEVRLVGNAADELPRHGGTVSMSPAGFASFVMPLMFVAMGRYLTSTTGRQRMIFAAVSLAAAAAILLTFTRAAWVGSMLGGIVFVVLARRRGLLRASRLVPLAACTLLLLLVFAPQIKMRLGANHSGAYDERVALMQMARNVVAAHPIIGAGIGNYSAVVLDHLTPDLEDEWISVVHNAYLLRAAETGLLGLVTLLALLAVGFRNALACTRLDDRMFGAVAIGWTAGMVALMWEMYWDIWQGFPYNALLWMMWGLTVTLARLERRTA